MSTARRPHAHEHPHDLLMPMKNFSWMTLSLGLLSTIACSEPTDHGDQTSGGNSASDGGTSSGGATNGPASGGTSNGGASTGGDNMPGNGGTNAGGQGTGGLGATGGNGVGGEETIPATFETVKLILTGTNPSCGGADCHGGNTHNPLDLRVDDDLYLDLTTTISGPCGDIPVVNPGDPENSALVKLLKGPCGVIPRMPANCLENCVPDEYILAVEQWISNGAPEN